MSRVEETSPIIPVSLPPTEAENLARATVASSVYQTDESNALTGILRQKRQTLPIDFLDLLQASAAALDPLQPDATQLAAPLALLYQRLKADETNPFYYCTFENYLDALRNLLAMSSELHPALWPRLARYLDDIQIMGWFLLLPLAHDVEVDGQETDRSLGSNPVNRFSYFCEKLEKFSYPVAMLAEWLHQAIILPKDSADYLYAEGTLAMLYHYIRRFNSIDISPGEARNSITVRFMRRAGVETRKTVYAAGLSIPAGTELAQAKNAVQKVVFALNSQARAVGKANDLRDAYLVLCDETDALNLRTYGAFVMAWIRAELIRLDGSGERVIQEVDLTFLSAKGFVRRHVDYFLAEAIEPLVDKSGSLDGLLESISAKTGTNLEGLPYLLKHLCYAVRARHFVNADDRDAFPYMEVNGLEPFLSGLRQVGHRLPYLSNWQRRFIGRYQYHPVFMLQLAFLGLALKEPLCFGASIRVSDFEKILNCAADWQNKLGENFDGSALLDLSAQYKLGNRFQYKLARYKFHVAEWIMTLPGVFWGKAIMPGEVDGSLPHFLGKGNFVDIHGNSRLFGVAVKYLFRTNKENLRDSLSKAGRSLRESKMLDVRSLRWITIGLEVTGRYQEEQMAYYLQVVQDMFNGDDANFNEGWISLVHVDFLTEQGHPLGSHDLINPVERRVKDPQKSMGTSLSPTKALHVSRPISALSSQLSSTERPIKSPSLREAIKGRGQTNFPAHSEAIRARVQPRPLPLPLQGRRLLRQLSSTRHIRY